MRHRLRDPITGRFIKKASKKSVRRVAKRMRAIESGKPTISIEVIYGQIIDKELSGKELPQEQRKQLIDRIITLANNVKEIDIQDFELFFNWSLDYNWDKDTNNNQIHSIKKYHKISFEDAVFIYHVLETICQQLPYDEMNVNKSIKSLLMYYGDYNDTEEEKAVKEKKASKYRNAFYVKI